MSNSNPLRYRRQFVLGPRPLDELATWRWTRVGAGLFVQVHDDLPLVQVRRNELSLTLLGYIIDPSQPEHSNNAVLRGLAVACSNAREVPAQAAELTGRFVLIVDDGNDTLLFHDPCGLREVFHTIDEVGETWCASQPDRIATPLGIQPDEVASEFMASVSFRGHHEPWWPGSTTPYREIRRLQPNHYLDLRTREADRYWPNRPLHDIEPEDAAQIVAQLLRSSVRAAAKRFPLALPVTAGMDSRTILAAARGIRNVFHYTAMPHGLDEYSADIRIPRRLLRRLGIEHHVLKCPKSMSDVFARTYRANTTPAHDSAGAIAEGLLASYPMGRTMLSGHCAEIARDTFGISHTATPDAPAMAELMGLGKNPMAIRCFNDWLENTAPVAEAFDYRVWDLFFWEQEYATWAANCQSQWDIVHERFTPFNQRGVLRTLLAVDPFFRQGPRYEIHRRIMQILWPDVLEQPFNPTDDSLQGEVHRMLRRMRESGSNSGLVRGLSGSLTALLPK